MPLLSYSQVKLLNLNGSGLSYVSPDAIAGMSAYNAANTVARSAVKVEPPEEMLEANGELISKSKFAAVFAEAYRSKQKEHGFRTVEG